MTNLPITGLIHVTGESDAGKSTFALECGAHPSEICFIDDDMKGRSIAKEMVLAGTEFGRYYDLRSKAGKMPLLDLHSHCLHLIDSIKADEFKVIIWDTWSRFERTFHPYVVKHPKEFREKYADMGRIKGGQQWGDSFNYEAAVLSRLTSLADLVFTVTHLKQDYIDNKPVPGKMKPDGKAPLGKNSIFRVWLLHTSGAAPKGLILKRLALRKFVKDKGIRTTNVLPLKLSPCTWDQIRHYLENPIGDREPTPGEIPTKDELNIIKGTLSPAQFEAWKLSMVYGSKEEAILEETNASAEPAEADQRRNQIAAMLGAGKSEAEVMEETGASLLEVLQAKGELTK